ncbi:PREDICTED: uncharacterized protein LOC105459479 [Wasmannia auropunctata]|uniref:uncharacterized protein LOC105459479 n=1 Tax=Wasmannia auropunctata TaxID=64793 RepID=UPI0005F022C0|nr:PREDICTED: uncharacterized protein LOC105459479 [Wasmannia auropunctata]
MLEDDSHNSFGANEILRCKILLTRDLTLKNGIFIKILRKILLRRKSGMSREDDTSNKLNGNTTWSLTLLSKDYTISGHPVRIALHNTFCILPGRENTMACKMCEYISTGELNTVSSSLRSAFGYEISQMTRPCDVSSVLSMLNNYFLYVSTILRANVTLNATLKDIFKIKSCKTILLYLAFL